jgi:hypothetical protein
MNPHCCEFSTVSQTLYTSRLDLIHKISVVDPEPDPEPPGSAFIWLSWIRIRKPGFLPFKMAFLPS